MREDSQKYRLYKLYTCYLKKEHHLLRTFSSRQYQFFQQNVFWYKDSDLMPEYILLNHRWNKQEYFYSLNSFLAFFAIERTAIFSVLLKPEKVSSWSYCSLLSLKAKGRSPTRVINSASLPPLKSPTSTLLFRPGNSLLFVPRRYAPFPPFGIKRIESWQ